jgi:uncharacterized repeat protein (TIGR03803 family)
MSVSNNAALCMAILAGLLPAAGQAQTKAPLYQFKGQNIDGAGPKAGLTLLNSTLYGTTYLGGSQLSGTLFTIDFKGNYQLLHSFAGYPTDGAGPVGGLTAVGGVLFGTTSVGGAHDHGTIFAYTPATGAYAVLWSFRGGKDAALPESTMVYRDNALFGTSLAGGAMGDCANLAGCGTIFKLDLAHCGAAMTTCAEAPVYSFRGGSADGSFPLGGLTFYHDALYGTAAYGGGTGCYGAAGCGTIFRYDLRHGTTTQLHAFQGGEIEGSRPLTTLTFANGLLYGTTATGLGTSRCQPDGCGTVYSINPAAAPGYAFTTISDFRVPLLKGSFPDGALSVTNYGFNPAAPIGFAFGVTVNGGTTGKAGAGSYGTLYKVDLATGYERALDGFSGMAGGATPTGALVQSGPYLFGVTYDGGKFESGTVFRICLRGPGGC